MFVSGNDVYAAGDNLFYGATYWKNGTPVYLSKNTITPSTYVRSIKMSGNDVYAAGYEIDRTNPEVRYIPRLWKNGNIISLSGTAVASAMEVIRR